MTGRRDRILFLFSSGQIKPRIRIVGVEPKGTCAMPADLQKARELFLHAVGKLPPEEWDGYVGEACGGDAELEQQVGQSSPGSSRSWQFPGSAGRCRGGHRGLHVLAGERVGGYFPPRTPRHGHRPVQAPPADRRGRHGHGLHGRADPARPAQGRPQGHQGRAWTAARSSPASRPNGRPWP